MMLPRLMLFFPRFSDSVSKTPLESPRSVNSYPRPFQTCDSVPLLTLVGKTVGFGESTSGRETRHANFNSHQKSSGSQ
jgi:hypothetical protein